MCAVPPGKTTLIVKRLYTNIVAAEGDPTGFESPNEDLAFGFVPFS